MDLCYKNLTKFPLSLFQRADKDTLDALVLDFNSIPSIPGNISSFSSLTELSVAANKLTEIPDSVFSIATLRCLNLSANKLTQVSLLLGNLTNLDTLLIQQNKISDVPFTVIHLTKLKDLDISQNPRICVPLLPNSIRSLDLANNNMTTFPKFFCNLTNLTQLNVSENHIHHLPNQFKHLTGLRTLLAPCCDLGEIPDKTANALLELQTIDFSYNQFAALPASWLNHPTISSFDVDGNPFPDDYIPKFENHKYIAFSFPTPTEILPNLFLGNFNDAKNKEHLKVNGVTHILTTCHLPELYSHLFKYMTTPIDDLPTENLLPYFEGACKFIQAGRDSGAILVCPFPTFLIPFPSSFSTCPS